MPTITERIAALDVLMQNHDWKYRQSDDSVYWRRQEDLAHQIVRESYDLRQIDAETSALVDVLWFKYTGK